MAVLPTKKSELLTFLQTRAQTWVDKAADIGLTSGQANAVKSALETAADSFQAAEDARAASKSATMVSDDDIDTLRTAASDAVKSIRNFAERTNDPGVYASAQIPAPAAPSPLPPPNKATNLVASLESDGSLTISWKVSNANGSGGVVYNVKRKLPGQSAFTLLGASGGADKRFTDTTLPSTASGVQYVVYGQRGRVVGDPSETLIVTFGIGGNTLGAGANGFGFRTMPTMETFDADGNAVPRGGAMSKAA